MPYSRTMGKQEETNEELTASECAMRTGLTVRALRVYERYGLIVPPRAPSGWRRYGTRELTRLNTICVLKMAGLTLAQIRSIITEDDPSLRIILKAQVENWTKKKEQAERGQRVAEAALQRSEMDQSLSLDQLCDLIRSTEMAGKAPTLPDSLRRILEMPTAQAREVVKRLGARISPQWTQDFRQALETLIDPHVETLMENGTPVSDPAVQYLVVRHLELVAKYRVREGMLEWSETTDPSDAHDPNDIKQICERSLVQRILPRLKERPTGSSDLVAVHWTSNPFIAGYFAEAESRSAQCQDLDVLLREVQQHLRLPSSQEARRLVEKLETICRRHALGDPLIYARWAVLARPPPVGISVEDDRAAWGYLADLIGVT
jgi:DNA-binding transcriptional MerR regulator